LLNDQKAALKLLNEGVKKLEKAVISNSIEEIRVIKMILFLANNEMTSVNSKLTELSKKS